MRAIEDLGPMVSRRRGSMGVRAAAAEIGIGAATLSRIERGKLPDIETLGKICDWLGVEASVFIGSTKADSNVGYQVQAQVAFKKDVAFSQKTAQALGELILAAEKQFLTDVDNVGH